LIVGTDDVLEGCRWSGVDEVTAVVHQQALGRNRPASLGVPQPSLAYQLLLRSRLATCIIPSEILCAPFPVVLETMHRRRIRVCHADKGIDSHLPNKSPDRKATPNTALLHNINHLEIAFVTSTCCTPWNFQIEDLGWQGKYYCRLRVR
jgi:hypothetical protein